MAQRAAAGRVRGQAHPRHCEGAQTAAISVAAHQFRPPCDHWRIAPDVQAFLSRWGIFIAIMVANVVFVAIAVRKQRLIRKDLAGLAASFGWSDIRRPALGSQAVKGTWNGCSVGFQWQPAQKNAPAHLATRIDSPRWSGARFEMRSRAKRRFLDRPIMIFGPPKIEFFDPADAGRYEAWASDRTTVDSLLAIPGIRESLDVNLADGGVLSAKNGTLRIRRALRSPRLTGFKLTMKTPPDIDRIRAMAKEEWELLSMAV